MTNKNFKLIALNNDFRDESIVNILKDFKSSDMDEHFISFKSFVDFMNLRCAEIQGNSFVTKGVFAPLNGLGLYNLNCFYNSLGNNVFLNWRGIMATLSLVDNNYFKGKFSIIEYMEKNLLFDEAGIKIKAQISDKFNTVKKYVEYDLSSYEWLVLINSNKVVKDNAVNLYVNETAINKCDLSKLDMLNKFFSLGVDINRGLDNSLSEDACSMIIGLSLGNTSLDKVFDNLNKFKQELVKLKEVNFDKTISFLCDVCHEFDSAKNSYNDNSEKYFFKKQGLATFEIIIKDFFGFNVSELMGTKFIDYLILESNRSVRDNYFSQIGKEAASLIIREQYVNDIFNKIRDDKETYCYEICRFGNEFGIPFLKFVDDNNKKKCLDEVVLKLSDGNVIVDFLKLNSPFFDKSLLEEPLSNKKNGDTFMLDLIKSSKSNKEFAIEWLSSQNINVNVPNKKGITALMHIDSVPRHNKFKGLIQQCVLREKVQNVINTKHKTNKI